jgi:hypothetical protein
MPVPTRAKEPLLEIFHSKNESGDEPTNSTSSEVINQARNSTTGAKPKKRCFKHKSR